MKEWFTVAEIAAARSPELPGTIRNINKLADAEWRADPARARRAAGKGGGWEYHISLLPPGAQARLKLLHAAAPPAAASASATEPASKRWERFEALPKSQKDEAAHRLAVLMDIEALTRGGLGETAAVNRAATSAGVSVRSVYGWRGMVKGVARPDWLPALAPAYRATAARAECHPKAWDILVSDYLRPEEPRFSACYRRMRKAASAQGWLPIPSERALRRRLDAEVPAAVQTLARKGRDKAKTLYPAQKRSRRHFHAMQAVNADGHKLDVFVRLDDGTVTRVHLVAMQDLYSGMIVAWRLSDTENKETIRLVIGDMVERHGIPEKCWLDNGRGFASKWITGGAAARYRFKVREGDPKGLLLTLGLRPEDIHFTTPYHGQAKPIERAFGDLAEAIAKHPFCAGAYTGNRPDAKPENYASRAVPLEAFRAHVAREIAEHNERPGRRSETCGGRSFLETFKASLDDPATVVRFPTEAQRMLWLLASDKARAQRGSGEVHFYGNRYWSRELNQHAGTSVVVRFDPDALHDEISVYTLDDRLICRAPCIAPVGFDDVDAARAWQRDRRAHQKAVAEQLRLHRKLTADELARLFGAGEPAPEPQRAEPKVKRLALGAAQAQPISDTEFEDAFSRGLARLDADIIPFKPAG